MTNDIHVFLSDEEAEQLRALAKREDRSLNNTGRLLIRRGLAADPDLTEEVRTRRGRPARALAIPRHDFAAQAHPLGADSLLPDSLPRLTDFPARPMGLKQKGKKP